MPRTPPSQHVAVGRPAQPSTTMWAGSEAGVKACAAYPLVSTVPCLLQVPHYSRAQVRLLFGGPFAEALARLEAELAVGDQLLQVGGRAGPAVDRREHGLVDGERQVGADEV